METLSNCLRRIFPTVGFEGETTDQPYFPWPDSSGEIADPYETPPVMPADVFAAAGYALQFSGAYHHVIAEVDGRPDRAARQIKVGTEFIKRARATAAAWRSFTPDRHYSGDHPSVFSIWLLNDGVALLDLYAAWTAVWRDAGEEKIYRRVSSSEEPPEWWTHALFLLIAADEAARDMGFVRSDQNTSPWLFKTMDSDLFEKMQTAVSHGTGSSRSVLFYNPVGTISAASPDVVGVLPKARTSSVGCTLRSLSHHLALLPPQGIARAAWTTYPSPEAPPDERHMNLLLIPFPYSIPASAFEPQPGYAGEGAKRWGFFGLKQTWLTAVIRAKLVDFVKDLAAAAKREADAIHGIVFPELALDEETWDLLQSSLSQALPELELMIAGISSHGVREGNFVRVAVFARNVGGDERVGYVTTREKHHRWTLDRDEVLAYGLEGRLSPSVAWAEDIDLLSRRVDFAVIRQASVISAMICEDLARVDPCQELIRSIGPSIVFALLMDAPQLAARWPARYATILAEDPGSAVLTLTSRGLMTRQHLLGKFPSGGPNDRIIALWRDDAQTDPVQIACPDDCHAVRLTLSGYPVVDRTLDGREDHSAVAWRYANHAPVCLENVTESFSDVIGTDDLALQLANQERLRRAISGFGAS